MEKKLPLISVIVPVFNVEKYLRKCFESIKKQSYTNIEIIFVDDGSTDNSSSLCDELCDEDNRVQVIHQTNSGLSNARNVGIRAARGKYITCIDSDDYVSLDLISYLYKLLIKYDCKMSLCTHTIVYNNGSHFRALGDGSEGVLTAHDCIKSMLYHGLVDTSAWAKLYDKELFNDISYPKGMRYEDIGTTYKLFIKSGRVACGFYPKYYYLVRSTSQTNSPFSEKKLDLLQMTDIMAADVIKQFPDLRQATLRRQIYARFSTLNQMLNVTELKYIDIRNKIIKKILSHKKQIIMDSQAPTRDKIAMVLLAFNFKLYKFLWELYVHKVKAF